MKKIYLFLLAFVCLFAVACGEKTYKVTFNDLDDSTTDTVKEVKENEKAVKPTDPTKEGYKFVGWFTDEALTKPYDFNSAVTADLVLYAKFEEASQTTKYTVTFKGKDGAVIETQEVEEGKAATAPAAPEVEGFVFKGWDKAFDNVTGDLEVNAVYEEESAEATKFTVVFKDKDGKEIAKVEVEEGKAATAPAAPEVEGFIFKGWDKAFDNVTGDLEVNALYEAAKKLTVTFKLEDGTLVDTVEVYEGSPVSQPSDPESDEVFLGWFIGETAYDFSKPVTENLEIVGKFFIVKEYTVNFIVDGEVIYSEVVEEGSDATAPSDPYKDGFEFSHWEGNYTNVSSDVDVVAVFDAIKFSVLFVVDGDVYHEVEVAWGESLTMPEDPSKEGYKFVGWDTEVIEVKEDLELTAQFEVVEYKIRYFSGSEEITTLEPKTYTINDTVSLPSYSIPNYHFMGWYGNSDHMGEVVESIEAGSTGIKMLYAFHAEADINGGVDCWSTEIPAGFNAGDGIDAISNLPEMFEMDFFKYLSDKNLLTSSKIDQSCQATTWAKFSGLNPNHAGDPKRIWNDTSTAKAGSANGYVSVYLFGQITLNSDLSVKDVTGGFLGTEPYKTKYWGLLNTLVLLQNYKVNSSSKYTAIDANTDTARAFTGFLIDGYFYGTQGAGDSYFAELRNTIPGKDYIYKLNGTSITKEAYAPKGLPTPVKDGYVFDGWYLDAEGTQAIGSVKHDNICKIYAKWTELK